MCRMVGATDVQQRSNRHAPRPYLIALRMAMILSLIAAGREG